MVSIYFPQLIDIDPPLQDKIDDLLSKKTTSLKYDKNQKFHEIVKQNEEKERQELRIAIQKFKESVLDSGRDIKFIFEKLDLDGNGTLTPDEIKAAFILLGIEFKEFVFQAVLDISDSNKDGRIDYDEFCTFVYQTESEMESAIHKVDLDDDMDGEEGDGDDREAEGEGKEEEEEFRLESDHEEADKQNQQNDEQIQDKKIEDEEKDEEIEENDDEVEERDNNNDQDEGEEDNVEENINRSKVDEPEGENEFKDSTDQADEGFQETPLDESLN